LNASVLDTSGFGAPSRTTTPTPTRPTVTRPCPSSLPDFISSSMTAGGAITTSAFSPAPTCCRMAGAVANVILTSVPVSLRKVSAAATSPGSTAPPLSTLISAPSALPAAKSVANIGKSNQLFIVSSMPNITK